MGYQNQYALVSMTNKDVYYVTKQTAKELMALIERNEQVAFFETDDAKSGAYIAIALSNISSIVIPGGFGQTGGDRG